MDTSRTIQYWLEGSQENYQKAVRDIKAQDYVYGLFWLHLACEKLLKAVVITHTSNHPPYTHELKYLASKAGLTLTQEQKDFLEELIVFQIETRYPEEYEAIKEKATPEKARTLLKQFEIFKSWVQKN
jgi:HEPN domain-containing protein